MKTNQEIIDVIVNYYSRPYEELFLYFMEQEEIDLDAVDEIANKLFEGYQKTYLEGRDPIEDSLYQLNSCLFGQDMIEKCKTEEDVNPIGEEELFYFQVGTTRTRANHFLKEGLGYVRFENIVGKKDWDIISRTHGLQVSELKKEAARSEFERLQYYATQQSGKSCGDEPCVLVGSIPSKYVYKEHNTGEYAISRKDYDKIREQKIMTLEEYHTNCNK